VTLWNAAATEFFGWSEAEVLGRPLPTVPEGRLQESRLLQERLLAGERLSGVELLRKTRSGNEVVVRLSASPLRDASGEIAGCMAVVVERLKIEEERERSRMLSESIVSGAVGFLKSGDVAGMGTVLLSRYLELAGAEYGIILDTTTDDTVRILAACRNPTYPDDSGSWEITSRQIRDSGMVFRPEPNSILLAPIVRRQTVVSAGRTVRLPEWHLEISSFLGTPLDTGDSVVGMIGVANRKNGFSQREKSELEAMAQTVALAVRSARADSDRVRAMESLRQSQKFEALGQLAGGIAHDFNNLLTVIQGYAQLLLRFLREEKLSGYAKHIDHASRRAAELTQQLLAFSRRQVMETRVLNIRTLLLRLESMLQRLIPENISLEIEWGDIRGNVRADAGLLEQVFINLILNARDAQPQGGSILIAVRSMEMDEGFTRVHCGAVAGRYIAISVIDRGTGMSEEVRQRAFDPFFTTKKRGKGTGLGLSMVYGIVKQSGGYITLESELGKGTTCTVYLPETDEREDVAEVAPVPTRAPARGSILLVEDEKALLEFVREVLESQGYRVHAEHDPNRALETFDAGGSEFDLVVTD
ncbi:MAG TPA: ATP-binding protein, partial [Verrucomicrobiae bacterium]|nr:ATP-binding protein [Verrucomicrobiae bacterium]